jgi:uncharacterized protein DUF6745
MPVRLQALTSAHEAVVAALRDEWLQVGLSTGPADRLAAERGVRQAYVAAGLPPPSRFVWRSSPLTGAIAADLLGGPSGLEARAPVVDSLRFNVLDTYHQWLDAPARAALWREVCGVASQVQALAVRLRALIRQRIAVPVQQATADADSDAGRRLAWSLLGVGGQHDAGWLMLAVALQQLVPGVLQAERLDAVIQAARSAGWWWSLKHVAVLTERPTVVHHDSHGLLHCASGPAIAYPDGFAVWAWHGVTTSPQVILCPETLTVRQIRGEPSPSVRQVMLERYHYDRYLRDAGAERINEDDTGTLWSADFGEERLVTVEVRDSTPDPAGNRRSYWLRVPPWTRTARDAVAWTFGLHGESYRPRVET